MNRNRTWIFSLILFVTSIIFSSCIYDNRDDCGEMIVGFDYSHNMLSSNALKNEVNQITLYIFDKDDRLVYKEANGEKNVTNDYAVRISDLKVGKYKFVAWGKSDLLKTDEADFIIPDLIIGASVLDDLSYYMKRASGQQQHELNNLLVGITETEIKNTQDSQHITVNLKKVNNKIRVILLPYTSGSQLNANNFLFSITDKVGNGHIKYDYSLLKDDSLTYHPYYLANVEPKASESLSPNEIDRAVVAEINTSRLIEANNPRLIITSKVDNKELVSVNLPWFFSLTGMESHKNWSLQEYLDRQDEYAITLFVQGDTWVRKTIIINGWVINDIGVDM